MNGEVLRPWHVSPSADGISFSLDFVAEIRLAFMLCESIDAATPEYRG